MVVVFFFENQIDGLQQKIIFINMKLYFNKQVYIITTCDGALILPRNAGSPIRRLLAACKIRRRLRSRRVFGSSGSSLRSSISSSKLNTIKINYLVLKRYFEPTIQIVFFYVSITNIFCKD